MLSHRTSYLSFVRCVVSTRIITGAESACDSPQLTDVAPQCAQQRQIIVGYCHTGHCSKKTVHLHARHASCTKFTVRNWLFGCQKLHVSTSLIA